MRLFLSDLHLSPATPGIEALFLQFLAGPAREAEAVYILGDLFEVWVGDDDLEAPLPARIAAAMKALADTGVHLACLHGNRDFLLGTDFAAASGATLLPDPYVLSTPEWQFILAHGDHLCTDDAPYMAFREQVRNPAWQSAFLARPLSERRAMAQHMRDQSQAGKTGYARDLPTGETEDFLREHGYATFIHGHTHLPGHHDHIVDGIHVERWVLSDWREDRGDYLAWDGEQLTRHVLTPSP